MERIKRPFNNSVHDLNNNKRRKLDDQSNTLLTIIDTNKSSMTRLENLPNEIIYEIFEYLDIYHVYQSFFKLKQRFRNFLINSSLPMKINIPTMSKSSFEQYHNDIILPNKHRINILCLSNPFTVDLVFSPPRFIFKFLQLERLILDNFKSKYLENIFMHLKSLPKLRSLTIHPIDYVPNPTYFYLQIFRLPKLKFCQITYETKNMVRPPLVISAERFSPIEHLIINTQFSIDSFDYLLSYVPRLRRLSINSLIEPHYRKKGLSPMTLKHLEYISLKIDDICFNQFEILIKYFFQHIQVLKISTKYDIAFLDAKRWEELILSYMPNLTIFDIYHDGSVLISYNHNHLTFHQSIEQFNSSFWIERKWFFAHQHTNQETLNHGIFYSIEPYRRNDYKFYWQLDKQVCSHGQQTNFNSVQHVDIHNEQATKNFSNYFSNATELTLKHYLKTPENSMGISLNHIVSLTKLKKLVIQSYNFPFEELVKLLSFTPNLHTLKFQSNIYFYPNNLPLIQQSKTFHYVSKINQIKNFDYDEKCTLEYIQMIVNLFPRLESLKTGFDKKEIEQITRFIFSKIHDKTYNNLVFLCVSYIPKVYLKKLKILIKLEKLLDDFLIDLVDYNLYLWL